MPAPTMSSPRARGLASGSLQGRNPREGVRCRCAWLYGDCGLRRRRVAVIGRAGCDERALVGQRWVADVGRGGCAGDDRMSVECTGDNEAPMPAMSQLTCLAGGPSMIVMTCRP
jgi:hypothetical protein